MALVMYRCFECEFISSSMQEVKIHIRLEHEGGVKYSESSKDLNEVEISGRCETQDVQCVVPQEALHRSLRWTGDMVLHLIECFKKHEDKFHKIGYTSKQVWNDISKDFSTKYFNVSGESCYEKWRSIKRTYKRIKRNFERTGSSQIRFRYFEEMDAIYSKSPEIIRPLSITATKSLTKNDAVTENEVNSAAPITTTEESNASRSSSPFRHCKRQAVPHCCTHLLMEMKKIEKAREVSEQKRHEEKMAILRELIDIKRQKLLMLQKLS